MILRTRLERALLQALQSLHHQLGAGRRHARRQSHSGIFGRDGDFLLQQDVAGIQAFIQPHGGDAGHALAVGDGPLNGRGTAILRQQRAVQVQVAVARQIEHPLGNQAAIGNHDDGLWR